MSAFGRLLRSTHHVGLPDCCHQRNTNTEPRFFLWVFRIFFGRQPELRLCKFVLRQQLQLEVKLKLCLIAQQYLDIAPPFESE